MQVKKFEAPTIQEALDAIKRELGPEAIILQTKRNKKGFGLLNGASVEITAAVSERSIQKKTYLESRVPEATAERIKGMPASQQAKLMDQAIERKRPGQKTGAGATAAALVRGRASAGYNDSYANGASVSDAPQAPTPEQAANITQKRYIDIDPENNPVTVTPARPKAGLGLTMEEELRELKRMLADLQISQNEAPARASANEGESFDESHRALKDAFEHLILAGIDRKLARAFLKRAEFELSPALVQDPDAVLDQIALEVMNSVSIRTFFDKKDGSSGRKVIALIGPTGVGKTTTLAKIASHAIFDQKKKVGLINLDTFKVGATEQLSTYAKLLNVPFRSVSGEEELKTALQDFQSLDLVLVDTTGRSQRDQDSLIELRRLLSSQNVEVENHLCLSATTRDAEALDIQARFAVLKPQSLVVTKLDEAITHGMILNVSVRAKLPLSFFTTGQRVPEDFEAATKERVAALVMDL